MVYFEIEASLRHARVDCAAMAHPWQKPGVSTGSRVAAARRFATADSGTAPSSAARARSKRAGVPGIAGALLIVLSCGKEKPPEPPPVSLAVEVSLSGDAQGRAWRLFLGDREVGRVDRKSAKVNVPARARAPEHRGYSRDFDLHTWDLRDVVATETLSARTVAACGEVVVPVRLPPQMAREVRGDTSAVIPVRAFIEVDGGSSAGLAVDNRGGPAFELRVDGVPYDIPADYAGSFSASLLSAGCPATVTLDGVVLGTVQPQQSHLIDTTGRRCYRWRRRVFVTRLGQVSLTDDQRRELRAREFERRLEPARLRAMESSNFDYLLRPMPREFKGDMGGPANVDELLEVPCR